MCNHSATPPWQFIVVSKIMVNIVNRSLAIILAITLAFTLFSSLFSRLNASLVRNLVERLSKVLRKIGTHRHSPRLQRNDYKLCDSWYLRKRNHFATLVAGGRQSRACRAPVGCLAGAGGCAAFAKLLTPALD
jgi:hypothetical protein